MKTRVLLAEVDYDESVLAAVENTRSTRFAGAGAQSR
jgi:hypothetical protein